MVSAQQQVFTIAFLGLRAQGFKQSLDPDTKTCKYRGPNGLKCALGHCIPDEEYDPSFENVGAIFRRLDIQNIITRIYGEVPIGFLIGLQRAHDLSFLGVNPIESRLREFAANFNLEVPE